MPEKKIKIASVGCGYWGPNLIRNFSNLPEAVLVKVCDIDENKLKSIKQQYPNLETTKDFNELLDSRDIDAVAIATPVSTHFELVRKALEKGKHVFVEKPITQNSKQAEELFNLALQNKKVLMVDHTFEYSPAINRIKEIIANKELGKIHYIHAEWLSLGKLQPEINVIWDLAVHVFSLLIYILGEKPISIKADADSYFRKEIGEVASIILEFPENIKVHIVVSWTEPEKTRKMTIIGSKKMLVYNMLDKSQVKVYEKSVAVNGKEITYLDGEAKPEKIEEAEPLSISCSHFIDCIKNNKKPRSDAQAGLEIVKILEAADESIKNNGKKILTK